MNFNNRRLLIICIGVLAIALAGGTYLLSSMSTSAVVSSAETAVLAQAETAIIPHRAIYDLKLLKTRANGSINNVSGKMLFAWDDACDGWTIEQRLDMNYQYEGGGSQNAKTSLATWEAKDASLFRFNVRREANGETTEVFSGQAQLASSSNREGGTAHYTLPTDKSVDLQPATLFPSVHTLELLRQAKAGNHIYTREVFDGADEQGRNFISAFIGDPQTLTAPKDAKNAELLQGRAWPVRMAFYSPDNATGTPDYEMTMVLLENGIATQLTIDYPDFSVDATMAQIEPLKRPTCL